jgi:hypothetical protein
MGTLPAEETVVPDEVQGVPMEEDIGPVGHRKSTQSQRPNPNALSLEWIRH